MLAASDSLELNTDGAAGYPTKEGSGTFEKAERLRRTTRFNGSNPYAGFNLQKITSKKD